MIKVILADDHAVVRRGIRQILTDHADMEVVGEAANGGDAVDKCGEVRPDVVLMDSGMPGLSSFEATRQIKKNRPETKVLFLTMYDDEDYLVEGMEVDIVVVDAGLLLKQRPAEYTLDELIARITPENRHKETDWGPPVVGEAW